jgi:hypothetical protein
MEIWKVIKEFPDYEVSDLGRVKSNKKGSGSRVSFLKHNDNGRGYKQVSLRHSGVVKNMFVHRLVADAFIDFDPLRLDINHINGVKDDNRLVNLERCNKHENMRHAYDTGLLKAPNGKLSEYDVDIIRRMWHFGSHRNIIANVFKISFAQISRIVNNQAWT